MLGRLSHQSGTIDRGASSVEFALVVPIFLMVVFGIITFGMAFAQQLGLSNGARQAARFGVVSNRTCGDIAKEAQDAAATIGMSPSAVRVKVWYGSTEPDYSTTPYCDPTATPSPFGAGSVPCAATPADPLRNIYVRTEFTRSIKIPFAVGLPKIKMASVGVFRCEFSS